MISRYGHAPGGARCVGNTPAGHWQTMTFIAGLRADELTVPWVLDRAMNGEAFKAYLRSQLGPTLKPGDIVICDNCRRIKSPRFKASSKRKGRRSDICRPTAPI